MDMDGTPTMHGMSDARQMVMVEDLVSKEGWMLDKENILQTCKKDLCMEDPE